MHDLGYNAGRIGHGLGSASLRSALMSNSECEHRGAGGRSRWLRHLPHPACRSRVRLRLPRSLSARPMKSQAFERARHNRFSCPLRGLEWFAINGSRPCRALSRVFRPARPAASVVPPSALSGRHTPPAHASAGGGGSAPASGTMCRLIEMPPAAPPSEARFTGSVLDL